MIIRTVCLILILLLPLNSIYGQQLSDLKFNHLSFVLGQDDIKALTESSYVNDTLGVFETRITEVDSVSTTTTCFLFGRSNYLELFQASGDDPYLGYLTIVLSVDKINGNQELKKKLDSTYHTFIRVRERNYDDLKVPWYESLAVIDTSIVDSTFMAQSHFWFWIMNYRKEYFDHNGYTIENDEVTRENYLEKYSEERADRIIENFTGIGMKLNDDERRYLTKFFEFSGFKKLGENEYLASDNFRFLISDRPSGDQYTLEFIEFETSENFTRKTEIRISDHISVSIQGNNGCIFID